MYTNTAWVDREFKRTFISDDRLVNRLVSVTRKLAANPEASIPQAIGNWKETRACYDMLNNQKISSDVILSGHQAQTLERMRAHPVVLAVQDTSSINYAKHRETQGLGSIITDLTKRGILLHTTFAVTPEGVALGIIHQKYWARPEYDPNRNHWRLPIEEKESYKWIEAIHATPGDISPETQIITVCDREADIYEMFQYGLESGKHFLIRADKNRMAVDESGSKLKEVINSREVTGEFHIQIPRNTKENVPSRQVCLKIKHAQVTIKPPMSKASTKGARNLELYAVLAEEAGTRPEGLSPIKWLLLTDIAIQTLEDAVRAIKWYAQRWKIERFHYILKSGCAIEDLQLRTRDRLENALAIYSIIAWKILHLTYEARVDPTQSCEVIFKKHEWQALYCYVNRSPVPPEEAPTLYDAVMMVARLGGFLGRKSDGYPGVKVLWRGLTRLYDISEFWSLLHFPDSSNVNGNA